jgi:hypothetical protein
VQKVKAASTCKLLDSLPRNSAMVELCLVNSMWLTVVIQSERYQNHHMLQKIHATFTKFWLIKTYLACLSLQYRQKSKRFLKFSHSSCCKHFSIEIYWKMKPFLNKIQFQVPITNANFYTAWLY